MPDTRYQFNNPCRDILAIAQEMMRGEIAYRQGEFDAAFAHLRHAVELDDHLHYDEPWGWMQPVRHALGALLLEQNRVDEALAVYQADLGYDANVSRPRQHLDNVWALAGYTECLERTNQPDLANVARQRLHLAQARADTEIQSSCFCRLNVGDLLRLVGLHSSARGDLTSIVSGEFWLVLVDLPSWTDNSGRLCPDLSRFVQKSLDQSGSFASPSRTIRAIPGVVSVEVWMLSRHRSLALPN